jgi:hypothetical protein
MWERLIDDRHSYQSLWLLFDNTSSDSSSSMSFKNNKGLRCSRGLYHASQQPGLNLSVQSGGGLAPSYASRLTIRKRWYVFGPISTAYHKADTRRSKSAKSNLIQMMVHLPLHPHQTYMQVITPHQLRASRRKRTIIGNEKRRRKRKRTRRRKESTRI